MNSSREWWTLAITWAKSGYSLRVTVLGVRGEPELHSGLQAGLDPSETLSPKPN